MGKKSRRARQARPQQQHQALGTSHSRNDASATLTSSTSSEPFFPADKKDLTADDREVADRWRNDFLKTSSTINSGNKDDDDDENKHGNHNIMNYDPWNPDRVWAFDTFTEYLHFAIGAGRMDFISDEDVKVLKKVASKKRYNEEPAFFQATAKCLLAGVLLKKSNEFEDGVYYMEQTIKLCDTASDEEKRRTVMLRSGGEISVGAVLSELRTMAEKQSKFYREFGVAAGHACEVCEKSRDDIGVEEFRICGTCQMAYYCSEACQKKDWKSGRHKQVCRAPGEFKVGDIAHCFDEPIAATGGPGGFVEIISPVVGEQNQNLEGPERWLVKPVLGRNEAPMVVCTDRLKRMRPSLREYLADGKDEYAYFIPTIGWVG